MTKKKYFVFSKQEHKELPLPPKFDEDIFDAMHKWLRYKPIINPPHHRDLLHPDDGNYNQEIGDSDDIDDRHDANPHSHANRNFGQKNPVIDITFYSDDIRWRRPWTLQPMKVQSQRIQEINLKIDTPSFCAPLLISQLQPKWIPLSLV